MANSLDPDETAHNEPSHLDLHCLHRYLFWSAGPKGLMKNWGYFHILWLKLVFLGKTVIKIFIAFAFSLILSQFS